MAWIEQRLVTAHLEEFPPTCPPRAPTPAPVDRDAVRRYFREEELRGVCPFTWSARRVAKRKAKEQAERAIRAEERQRAEARRSASRTGRRLATLDQQRPADRPRRLGRSEEHTSELQSRQYLVCRLLLEK